MEDAITAAKRQAIEAEGIPAPKAAEPKRSRFDRRLENRKKVILDKLVLMFFKDRSLYFDLEGEEVAGLLDLYEAEWKLECKTFNRGRQPFKLRYEAFSESVEFYLKMEKNQMEKTKEENMLAAFEHWFRRKHVWRTSPLNALWYWVKALGNKEKYLNHWKTYFKSLEAVKKLYGTN